jgi:hypothetical protein
MAYLAGGGSGLLCRDHKGKEADRLVTRIGPGVVSLVAELRGHERQAAEELSQWKAHIEESRSPRCWPARSWTRCVKCCGLLTGPRATGSVFRRHHRARNQQPRRARHGAPELRDRLRAGLDLILQQRGADMADVPGGASGLLARDYKGKEADRLVPHRPRG